MTTPSRNGVHGQYAGAIEIHGMPGHLIRRMHQAALVIFDTEMALAGYDLTSVQYGALSVVAARPGLDQAALASLIAFDRPTTGGVIDRLEAKGFVRREIDGSDRRVRRLYPQPAAEAVLKNVRPAVLRAQHLMLQGLSEREAATFMRLLGKAVQAVGDLSRPTVRSISAAADDVAPAGRRRAAG
jgi:DNA-binding MarR family transcriptional regulator